MPKQSTVRLTNQPEVEQFAQRADTISLEDEGLLCSCWTYQPKPTCDNCNSVRHYWAW